VSVVGPLVWQQIYMTYALLTGLVLALKGFLQSFDTGMAFQATYAGSSSGAKGVYGLGDLSKASHISRKGDRSLNEKLQHRPSGGLAYSAQISHPSDGQEASIRSGHSQHPIIKREVQYTVEYEAREDRSQESLYGSPPR